MAWSPVPGYVHAANPSSISQSADYILLLDIEKDAAVEVGALGRIELARGTYAYCGSARAGLWRRVRRHLSDPVRKRWHIDHITPLSSRRIVLWKEHEDGGECSAAEYLSRRYIGVRGFGSSDCMCSSHLFFIG
ncbi:MAG: GIY-YIG nuclease family protein [Thermoplasmatota archaeon]